MKKGISIAQKKANHDIAIALFASLAVFVMYIIFQRQINGFVFGQSPLLLRTVAAALVQYGLAGLGITIVCIRNKESFASHGLRLKGLFPAVGFSLLFFIPRLIYLFATGEFKGYLPFQGVKLTAEILSSSFPQNILAMLLVVAAWGFFEGFNYAVLADKINKRYPVKYTWLNWGAIACAIFCILIHGAVGLTPSGIIEMLTVFILIYGMLIVKEKTGNAWGCVFVFLFIWNAF